MKILLLPRNLKTSKPKKQEEKKGKKHEEGVVKSQNRSQIFVLLCYAICFLTFVKQTTPTTPQWGKHGLKSEVGEFSHFLSFFQGDFEA